VGEAILVAPVATPGVQERSVYLPAGVWYDLWTGERLVAGNEAHPELGGRTVAVEAPLDRMPIFLRGGTVVPFETLRQTTAEAGDGVLHLLVLADEAGSAEGSIYGDAGEGWGFREGSFWRASVAAGGGTTELTVEHGEGLKEIRWDRAVVHGPAELGLLWGNDAEEGRKKTHHRSVVLPEVGAVTIDVDAD
jgi:alpha-glucosidase (family GH31 glycosyl hydrolase)